MVKIVDDKNENIEYIIYYLIMFREYFDIFKCVINIIF